MSKDEIMTIGEEFSWSTNVIVNKEGRDLVQSNVMVSNVELNPSEYLLVEGVQGHSKNTYGNLGRQKFPPTIRLPFLRKLDLLKDLDSDFKLDKLRVRSSYCIQGRFTNDCKHHINLSLALTIYGSEWGSKCNSKLRELVTNKIVDIIY